MILVRLAGKPGLNINQRADSVDVIPERKPINFSGKLQ